MEGGLQCFARAASEAGACGALELRAVALLETGSALAHRAANRRHDEAIPALQEAIDLAQHLGSGSIAGRACYELAWIAFLESRYERVEYWASQALEHGGDDPEVRAAVGAVRGKAYSEVGRYGAAIAILRPAERDAEATQDAFKITWVLAALGRVLMLRGSFDEARPILERAVDIALRAGLVGFAPCPESYLGELCRLTDETDRAESLLDQHSFPNRKSVV